MQTIEQALAWIQSLKPVGYKPGNERMLWMLERMKHPERRLKFVHIAGTNGKGSNVAYMASVLRKCGYEVGTFISPHVTTYFSRISSNGQPIEEQPFIEICQQLRPLVEELATTHLGSPTEFEVLTMMAILYFARYTYPDIVLWETGLGGRYDSTNVVHPIVTLITNVGYDHTKILGDTLEKIAWDKAGIIKPGVPVVTAVEDDKAFRIIEQIAKEKRAKVYRLGTDFHVLDPKIDKEEQSFRFTGTFKGYDNIRLGLKGVHQFANAATSVMTLEVLRQFYAFIIEEEDLLRGMEETVHPGRLEVFGDRPKIVLDGAHNAEGSQVLAKSIPQLFEYNKLIFVTSIMNDKPIDAMMDAILPLAHEVVVTKADNPRAVEPMELKQKIESKYSHLPIYIEEDPCEAVKKALSLSGETDLVLVSGSLFLIEAIRDEVINMIGHRAGV